ncbi:nuclear pore complex protein Nup98-Nup96-like [Uloborus diversus]|uniref:nuclear pore complex protein Nup98-Nup96-like n=1 Tax=Uloborus diversus TaxID=327109 RepID=UPI00240932CF|nr:nuclear pore complex protein Nup98-Nup96-like [Uloborus diversus]
MFENNPFGTVSAFAGNTTDFGAEPATNNVFGASTLAVSTPNTEGLFETSTPLFLKHPTSGTGLFGQPSTGFGAPASISTNTLDTTAFGVKPATSYVFGASTFGVSTPNTGGQFRTSTPTSGTGLFGQPDFGALASISTNTFDFEVTNPSASSFNFGTANQMPGSFPKYETRWKTWRRRRNSCQASNFSRIRSKHFAEICSNRPKFRTTCLKPNVRPAIFSFPAHSERGNQREKSEIKIEVTEENLPIETEFTGGDSAIKTEIMEDSFPIITEEAFPIITNDTQQGSGSGAMFHPPSTSNRNSENLEGPPPERCRHESESSSESDEDVALDGGRDWLMEMLDGGGWTTYGTDRGCITVAANGGSIQLATDEGYITLVPDESDEMEEMPLDLTVR